MSATDKVKRLLKEDSIPLSRRFERLNVYYDSDEEEEVKNLVKDEIEYHSDFVEQEEEEEEEEYSSVTESEEEEAEEVVEEEEDSDEIIEVVVKPSKRIDSNGKVLFKRVEYFKPKKGEDSKSAKSK